MEIGFVATYRRARSDAYARWLGLIEGRETVIKASAAVAMAFATAAAAQWEFHTPLSPIPYTGQVFMVLLTGALLGSRWGAASQGLYVTLGLIGLPVYAGGEGGLGRALGLSGGYLVGFILAAALVGWLMERRTAAPNGRLLAAGPVALGLLTALAALDVWFLTTRPSYLRSLWAIEYGSADAVIGLLLVLGLSAVAATLALYARARHQTRDRLELFLAMVLGIVVIYACGALGFWAAGETMGRYAYLDPMTPVKVLELSVIPFVPADLLKAALATALFALALPRRFERARASV